jgi:PadR family transcriptional regulator PadR
MTDSVLIQLRKGALELCVLAMLSRQESYAYEISSTLSSAVGMGESTIYPLMRRMQKDGLVESRLVETKNGPSRKYYRLTDVGQKVFESQRRDWMDFMTGVNGIIGDSQ